MSTRRTRLRAGNGQVIGVVAEAATGKSRLCYEFPERCRAAGMRVIAQAYQPEVHECRAHLARLRGAAARHEIEADGCTPRWVRPRR